MMIQDFYNLMVVVSCPKCGQDPDHMTLETLEQDHFICKCDNCQSRIKVTYKTEIIGGLINMTLLKQHQQNSILYPRPKKIDGKEEAHKALAKAHGKTKKHETTKHYLTIQLEKGTIIEWIGDSFLIKGPFTCKIIDNEIIRIKNKEG